MLDPNLPFIDLHRHLDGNVRLETILELAQQHNISLPAGNVEDLRPYIQVSEPQPGVMAFLERFHWLTAVMVDYDACRRIAYENVEDARIEGLDYVELRFSPCFMAEMHNLKPEGVVEAVVDGINTGRHNFNQPVNLIGIISRTYGLQMAWVELNALLTQYEQIVGLDLAGDEANWPGEMFIEQFKRGREVGWKVTVHAGENDSAESIWQAINELGANRIGHAVRATDDPMLIEYLREHDIGIEANLTSNVQTSTVSDYPSHPVRQFLDNGILVALCSDDPGISQIDLRYEFEVAAPKAGLSFAQIQTIQRNSLEMAFLSASDKRSLIQRKRNL